MLESLFSKLNSFLYFLIFKLKIKDMPYYADSPYDDYRYLVDITERDLDVAKHNLRVSENRLRESEQNNTVFPETEVVKLNDRRRYVKELEEKLVLFSDKMSKCNY